jgi:putative two-component system response regulator
MPPHHDITAARILIVDDEPANLKLLSMVLRTEGYRHIDVLDDPRFVAGQCALTPPDLILLDINMPHLDGFAVMDQLRALEQPIAVPIVVLTAQSGEDIVVRALQHGASDFLNKPVNRRELLARVHNTLMAHLAHRLLHDRKNLLEDMVRQRTRELRASQLDIVLRLGRASEFRDNETGQHILRMSQASALLARSAGWGQAECELMLNASPMHDVGKIGIPDGILLKPGPLTDDERKVMQTHTTIGAEILAGSGNDILEMARDIALSHHEKWDGTGYPHGLAADEIPESARIVAITDVFDALTSERPYKKPWTVSDALGFMGDNVGKHFDPNLFAQFALLIPEVQRIRERYVEPPAGVDTQPADRR